MKNVEISDRCLTYGDDLAKPIPRHGGDISYENREIAQQSDARTFRGIAGHHYWRRSPAGIGKWLCVAVIRRLRAL